MVETRTEKRLPAGQIETFAEIRDYAHRVALYMRSVCGNGRYAEAVSVTFKEHDGSVPYMAEPFVELTRDEAQKLMDRLWDCGLRPSEGTGSAGALAAVQAHLDDMRKIAFTELEAHHRPPPVIHHTDVDVAIDDIDRNVGSILRQD